MPKKPWEMRRKKPKSEVEIGIDTDLNEKI
jgi:hypothetical protein